MQDPTQPKSSIRLDLVPNNLLTHEDLVALTGYTMPADQAKTLKANKIRFYLVRAKEVRTTWYLVNNPMDLRQCACKNAAANSWGEGQFMQVHAPKVESMPPPDPIKDQPLEDRLNAFKTTEPTEAQKEAFKD